MSQNEININGYKSQKISGKILHLDGDKRYSEKAYNYYKKVGLDAIVKMEIKDIVKKHIIIIKKLG